MSEVFFMVDIESTGVDIKADTVLEIGILECLFVDGLWRPGRSMSRVLPYSGQPLSEFAKLHMAGLYADCNSTPAGSISDVRDELLAFFAECGKTGYEVILGGWNATSFDIPMLHEKGYLKPPGYATVDGKDQAIGDHHYRYYELGGAVSLAQDTLGQTDRSKLVSEALELGGGAPISGKDHDALFDCYKQLSILNGLIKMMRQ